MADPVLIDSALVAGALHFVTQLLRTLRDERERWKQKRNGGTPEDKIVRHLAGIRKGVRGMRKEQAKQTGQLLSEHQKTRAVNYETRENTVRILDRLPGRPSS
ncbi:MAG: hypothetical protein KC729_00165 [Candidatus Eisenbacteria bacterium]|uniref:Uncharacterized protein n=1 Tax=Eiseniibacteriota bacterium TaxID=2212470 RepID=A0A956LV62_UNCEI|nr:hypothetical protein [Candidatus Eisenbacteria bacterium]